MYAWGTTPSIATQPPHVWPHMCIYMHTQACMHTPTKKRKELRSTDGGFVWLCLSPVTLEGKSKMQRVFFNTQIWTCLWVSACPLNQKHSSSTKSLSYCLWEWPEAAQCKPVSSTKQTTSPDPCSEEGLSQLPCFLLSLLPPRNPACGNCGAYQSWFLKFLCRVIFF